MGVNGCVKTSLTPSQLPIRKPTQGTGRKILSLQQILQRLPITLAQVEAGNRSENLLSEIC